MDDALRELRVAALHALAGMDHLPAAAIELALFDLKAIAALLASFTRARPAAIERAILCARAHLDHIETVLAATLQLWAHAHVFARHATLSLHASADRAASKCGIAALKFFALKSWTPSLKALMDALERAPLDGRAKAKEQRAKNKILTFDL